jgi:hypothetical protein
MGRHRLLACLAALLLTGCAGTSRVGGLAADDAAPDSLPVCHGHGCKLRTVVALDPAQWDSIVALFAAPTATPAEERERVARAIGRLERLVGRKAGTADDSGENQLLAMRGQLDCVDETANTQTYLQLLGRRGLLRWHKVGSPAHRGWPADSWVHNTAVLAEREGGARYAVDSWFYDNGRPAAVVPLESWLEGWRPEQADRAEADRLAALDAETVLLAASRPAAAPTGAR